MAARRYPDNVKPCADCGQPFPLPAGMKRREWLFCEACPACEPARLRARIQENVQIDEKGCWLWLKSLNTTGYGQISIHDRRSAAHVVAFEAFKGPVPEGQEVCHTCDVRRCCKPDHLFAGTRLDNVRDAWAKGRAVAPPRITGERHPKATLTDAEVAEVVRLRKAGLSQRAVARRFGVSQSTVWRFVHGETRAHG